MGRLAKTPVRTLALDPAGACGWAFNGEPELISGVWYLKGSTSEHAGAHLVRLYKQIMEFHDRYGIERIAFENASLGSRHENTKVYHNRVSGVILTVASTIGATWEHYPPTTIKAFAGHGRYDKHQLIAALDRHYGLKVRSEDECDAIWVLKLDEHRQTTPLAVEAAKTKKKSRVVRRRKKQQPELF